jgi:hypothetical protein
VGVHAQSIDGRAPDVGRALDEAWGITETGRAPFTAEQVGAALTDLRDLREGWRRLGPEEALAYTWCAPRR